MEVLIFHGLRNGLCVVRDLSPTSYWLSDLGFPISATGIIPEVAISSTPIDVVIGILQLLAAALFGWQGLKTTCNGVLNYFHATRWRKGLATIASRPRGEEKDEKNGYECGYNLLMMCVAEQSLKGFWNILLGIGLFILSFSFMCLAQFSYGLANETSVVVCVCYMNGAVLIFMAEMLLNLVDDTSSAFHLKHACLVRRKPRPEANEVKLIMRLRGGTKESGIARGSSEPTDAKAMNAVADSLLTARKRVIKSTSLAEIGQTGDIYLSRMVTEGIVLAIYSIALVCNIILPLMYFYPETGPVPFIDLKTWPSWWIGHGIVGWWVNLVSDVMWTLESVVRLWALYSIPQSTVKKRPTKGKKA